MFNHDVTICTICFQQEREHKKEVKKRNPFKVKQVKARGWDYTDLQIEILKPSNPSS